jgi:hypothetical protein
LSKHYGEVFIRREFCGEGSIRFREEAWLEGGDEGIEKLEKR